METEFSVDGQRFKFLGAQRGGASVYRGDAGAYLRLGSRETITRDVGLHRVMATFKYPVAPIISEGEIGSEAYFIEKSLGERSFRAIFQEDCEATRSISKAHFDAFISVMRKLSTAQLRTRDGEWDIGEFAGGINLMVLCRELPGHSDMIQKRFTEACERLKLFPKVLSHGDCNPANIYEGGIIDLEDSFHGPFGYDIISALTSIEWSPDTRNFEFVAQYRISPEQREHYLKVFDGAFSRAKLPSISKCVEDFAFCRAVWLCVGMHEWPRIQQWRYEKLITEFLS